MRDDIIAQGDDLFPCGTRGDWGQHWPNVAGISIVEHVGVLEAILARVPDGGKLLEIGAWACASTSWFAYQKPTAQFTACDLWPANERAMRSLLLAIVNVSMHDNVSLFWGSSKRFAEIAADNAFDVVFVDGDHRRDAVKRDLAASARLCQPCGSIFAHDYGSKWAGVTEAVDWFLASQDEWTKVGQIESLVEFRRA